MRLSNFERIKYGKEDDGVVDEYSRQDIIYRVFLGDRQVWERTAEEQSESWVATNSVTTTWKIERDFTLDTVTAATSITGSISWGDNDYSTWRSGNTISHQYTTEGFYDITLNCTSFLPNATLGRIAERNDGGEGNNYIVRVILGLIPFDTHRLNSTVGVFENITTITTVIVPAGITEIPQRLFYNTSIGTLELPESLETIGDYAFVSNNISSIKVPDTVSHFGEKCLGFGTNGRVIDNLQFFCKKDSSADIYAKNNGITPIYS